MAAVAVSLALTVAATPGCILLARRTGAMDRPGPLKPQTSPTPYLGGLALLPGIAVGALVSDAPAVLVPLVLVALLGLLDDVRDLPVGGRLLGEAAVGVAGAVVLGASSWQAVLGTAALVVVLVNAVNLVDGVDALAAGVSACGLAGAAFVATEARALMACAAAACVGFLVFNRPPARIYLGDAGAYLLGTLLAFGIAAPLVHGPTSTLGPALGLCGLAAYPLVEIASTLVRRTLRGSPLSRGDREHVYDRWMVRGVPPARVVLVLIVMHAVFVMAASVAVSLEADAAAVGVAVALGVMTGVAVVFPRGVNPGHPPRPREEHVATPPSPGRSRSAARSAHGPRRPWRPGGTRRSAGSRIP